MQAEVRVRAQPASPPPHTEHNSHVAPPISPLPNRHPPLLPHPLLHPPHSIHLIPPLLQPPHLVHLRLRRHSHRPLRRLLLHPTRWQ